MVAYGWKGAGCHGCLDQQPTNSARIFEGRHCLDDFLRCTGKNDLAVALRQLADGDGDVMLADTEESAGADDGVGDRFVRSDDDVVGLPDRLAIARELGAWRSIPR